MELMIQQNLSLFIILLSILFSLLSVFKNKNIDVAVEPIISGCSTIITFFIMIGYYDKFNSLATDILKLVIKEGAKYNGLLHIGAIVVFFCLIKLAIQGALTVLHSFSFYNVVNGIKNNKIFLLIFSIIFGAIRGMVIIILVCIPVVLFNSLVQSQNKINMLNDLKAYQRIENLVDSKKIEIISDGLKEDIASNTLVYYNGITLDQGIKSNDQIDDKAKDITKNAKTQREKAQIIYKWVGSNITYDDEKAKTIMDKSEDCKSGAIVTYQTRKGICFDYACLYTAMSKAVGLKTRIVVGEAYNGSEYVSHAWNQVYLSDENKWINVDSTFYSAGNYFDNQNFSSDHKEREVAGEF